MEYSKVWGLVGFSFLFFEKDSWQMNSLMTYSYSTSQTYFGFLKIASNLLTE